MHDRVAGVQARVVFALTAVAGVRTPFFQYLLWEEVMLVKTAQLNGEDVEDVTDAVLADPNLRVRRPSIPEPDLFWFILLVLHRKPDGASPERVMCMVSASTHL